MNIRVTHDTCVRLIPKGSVFEVADVPYNQGGTDGSRSVAVIDLDGVHRYLVFMPGEYEVVREDERAIG